MEAGLLLAVGVEQLTQPEARGILIQLGEIVGAGVEQGALQAIDLMDQRRRHHRAARKSVII